MIYCYGVLQSGLRDYSHRPFQFTGSLLLYEYLSYWPWLVCVYRDAYCPLPHACLSTEESAGPSIYQDETREPAGPRQASLAHPSSLRNCSPLFPHLFSAKSFLEWSKLGSWAEVRPGGMDHYPVCGSWLLPRQNNPGCVWFLAFPSAISENPACVRAGRPHLFQPLPQKEKEAKVTGGTRVPVLFLVIRGPGWP